MQLWLLNADGLTQTVLEMLQRHGGEERKYTFSCFLHALSYCKHHGIILFRNVLYSLCKGFCSQTLGQTRAAEYFY